MSRGQILATLLAVSFWQPASAISPPTFNSNSVPIRCSVGILRIELQTPYTADPANGLYRVSGTAAKFALSTPSFIHDGATLSVVDSQISFGFEDGSGAHSESLGLPSAFSGGVIQWATTHFADSIEDLTLKWRARFLLNCPQHGIEQSEWVETDFHVNPWNKGGAYEIAEFASMTGADSANTCYGATNHWKPATAMIGTGWDGTSTPPDMQTKWTAVHIGSHGYTNGAIQYDTTNPKTYFDGNDILNWRTSAPGNGVPPVNLALFDSCEVGQWDAPTNMLAPTFPPPIGRGAAGCCVPINSNATNFACASFYTALSNGNTLFKSLKKYILTYNTKRDPSNDELFLDSNALISGDKWTRLHGVYTGSEILPSTTWWMTLP